ncbi:DUF5719 family protein [Actinobaculum sp. 352]|uniref:DUF5719 family protein n=1 Tax=Actinobaculum sp. 352 TaxID=2490946 RepID=UPI000F7F5B85|nr:DUF5719 family protein [Actinobaculum sp. 352]RTE50123.1 hypothetical protein EKN07_02550 [Actinobaculum sp. 352]
MNRMQRLISGVAVLAAAAGSCVLALALPHSEPISVAAERVVSSSEPITIVCSGGLSRTFENGLDVTEVTEDVRVESWVLGTKDGLEGAAPTVTFSGSGVAAVGPLAFEASSEAREGAATTQADGNPEQILLAGGTLHVASDGDLRGTAMNPCQSASMDQWLVGSQSGVGTSNEILLANPGLTPVTVRLAAYGSVGRLDLGSSSRVTVDAQTVQRVSLDGIVESDSRIAVHVTTDAGAVAASMQEITLDGARAAGVSFVTPGQSGTDLIIPGINATEGQTANLEAPTLRIVNPGTQAATVDVYTRDDDEEEELAGGQGLTVAPGTVLDLSLAGLSPGFHSLRLRSSSEIAAGVELHRQSGDTAPRDIAWATARPAQETGAVVTGPLHGALVVTPTTAGEAMVTATPIAADGSLLDEITVTVPEASTASLSLPEGAVAVVFRADAPIAAAAVTQSAVTDGNAIDWVAPFAPDSQVMTRRVAVD